MGGSNDALRAARERMPSPSVPGECLSRLELAEAVNRWLWEQTGRRFELDDHLIGKWERGQVRWPMAAYRAAVRAVLGAESDAALGFRAPSRRPPVVGPVEGGPWSRGRIVDDAVATVEWDVINRRDAVRAVVSGTALLGPLAGWLEPLVDGGIGARGGALSVAEVEAVERVAATFRAWRSPSSGLGRSAVVGQLADVAERLRGAPAGPLTDRMFLAGAELARIAGSMAFDTGRHRAAQHHYGTAVRMAKAAGEVSFGATTLAAMARQAFDLDAVEDGLEMVLLAQRGARGSASPALRSLLACREAWGHARRGRVYAFRRAIDQAEQAQSDVTSTDEPRWLQGQDAAELAGTIGARYRDLARHDRSQARHAVTYVGRALALRDPTRVRNRTLDLVSLARAHLLTGDIDHAAAAVTTAVPLIDARRPGRVLRTLSDWQREAAPFRAVPAVRAAVDAIAALPVPSS